MSLLAIIPARGGSKGIRRKNIKYFSGKPLIGWTIDEAKKASCINRTIVSTEDEEIATVARNLGADVPFMRPIELAQDDSSGIAPVLDAISRLGNYEWVLLLQPTSPFRTAEDIDGIWKFCKRQHVPSAVSICEIDQHPYMTYEIDASHRLKPLINTIKKPSEMRRQELPKFYGVNGALYLAKTEWLLNQKEFIGPETRGFIMPPERSLDIDTPLDWRMAEFLMKA